MYHELEAAGRALCATDPGYLRYVLDESLFRAQMDLLASEGFEVLGVSQWVDGTAAGTDRVVLTFDDGCETDLLIAAPLLRERGFNATCFLTVDFLDRPGFLKSAQVRELASTGLEIGCHSMSHSFLNDVDDQRLVREVVEAKRRLEDLCGEAIRSFSCPGGRYDGRLVPLALEAGLDTVCTSKPVRNEWPASSALLGRVAVTRGMKREQFAAIARGRSLSSSRLSELALRCAKTLLGNRMYEKARATLLK
jgi:peptidoglycan/xylan/chitin deacetylase (PgdA/CDA1 family)